MARIRAIINASDAISLIDRLQQGFSNFRPLWAILRERFVVFEILRLFETDGASSGLGSWAPTSRPNPILRDTLDLFRSYTQQNAPGNINRMDAKTFVWGSDIAYAIFHETPERGKLRFPARPVARFVVENPEADRKIRDLTDEYVQMLIDGS